MFKSLNGQLTSADLLVSVVVETSRVLGKIVYCVIQLIAVICLPCFSEAFALPPEKVLAELSNSNIVSRKVSLKESSGVFGARGILEKDNGITKDCRESNGCCAKTIAPVEIKGDQSGNNSGKDSGFWSSDDHDGWWGFIGILPSLWLIYWASLPTRPNVN